MADTTILIRDPEIVRDIHELAERTGKPEEEVVGKAVRAQLAGDMPDSATVEARLKRVREVLAETDALPHTGAPLTDEDLYDEDGLPR